MGIRNLSEQVFLVTLRREPLSGNELEMVTRMCGNQGDRHVIVDFSLVEIMSSATICSLMILERLLHGLDCQLVLCSVPPYIMRIFKCVGLQSLFQFADDERAGLQWLYREPCLY